MIVASRVERVVTVPGPDPPRLGRLEHIEDKAALAKLVGAIIEATRRMPCLTSCRRGS